MFSKSLEKIDFFIKKIHMEWNNHAIIEQEGISMMFKFGVL